MVTKLPWLVLDMDEGLLRREATRRDAVQWGARHSGAPVVRRDGSAGHYHYVFGFDGDNFSSSYFIEREDAARNAGWDVDAEAKYPYPDRPTDMKDTGA